MIEYGCHCASPIVRALKALGFVLPLGPNVLTLSLQTEQVEAHKFRLSSSRWSKKKKKSYFRFLIHPTQNKKFFQGVTLCTDIHLNIRYPLFFQIFSLWANKTLLKILCFFSGYGHFGPENTDPKGGSTAQRLPPTQPREPQCLLLIMMLGPSLSSKWNFSGCLSRVDIKDEERWAHIAKLLWGGVRKEKD